MNEFTFELIPPCCFVCKHEKPSEYCELLEMKFDDFNSGFCPPGNCPLRLEEWPEPSKTIFEELSVHEPEKLARWIQSETLEPGQLTFAAEVLGQSGATNLTKMRTLHPLLSHPHPLVREGAIYGLGYCEIWPATKKKLGKMAIEDPSKGVRLAIQELMEDINE